MRSSTVSLMMILALFTSSGSNAPEPDRAQKCQKIDRQIRAIQARMRRGYSAAQGVRLDEKLRKLREERYRLCR